MWLSVQENFDLLLGQGKGKPVAVTVQPTDPAIQLGINANTNTVGYLDNWGAVDVHVAGTAVCDEQCGPNEQNGTFSGHVGGMSSQVTLGKGATELTFSALGLGPDTSYVALDDSRLSTLDINPKHGRKLSITMKKTDAGTLITFDPVLDIKLAMMLNRLSESLRVDMPAWLGDEIFDVMLGGAAKPSVPIPAPTCDAFGEPVSKSQIQVVSGSLRMSATSLATPVNVVAGMCLTSVDSTATAPHPLSLLQSGVCN